MRLCYAVMRFEQGWKVVSGQRRIGHYATEGSAVSAGARLALEALEAGHQVEFLVQQAGGELVCVEPAACLAHRDTPAAEPLRA